jgi:hypothetical protein
MADQYIAKQCDICHQSLYNGDRMILAKCQHRYHSKCLSWNGETNNSKCPICSNENMLLSSASKQKLDEEHDVSKKEL